MQAIHGMAPGIAREVLYFAPSLADSELTAALGAWVNDPNGPPIMNASLGECEQIPILNPILNNPLLNPVNGNGNPSALPVSQAVSQASEPATTQLLQQAVMEGRTFFAASGDNGSSCTLAYPGANGVTTRVCRSRRIPRTRPSPRASAAPSSTATATSPPAAARARLGVLGRQGEPVHPRPRLPAGRRQPEPPVRGRQNGNPTNTGQLCRGVPDVAALSGDAVANGYSIVSDGQDAGGSGTSLSSPLWAGMWADVLSTAPPGATYGFANPSIYAIAQDPARYAAAFTDITAGANGLNPALGGYDYVTGFGAPRLAGLISQVQAVTGIAGRAGRRRQRVHRQDRARLDVRPPARRQGHAQAPLADRDGQRRRLPRPRRRPRRAGARGRARGGQASAAASWRARRASPGRAAARSGSSWRRRARRTGATHSAGTWPRAATAPMSAPPMPPATSLRKLPQTAIRAFRVR